MTRYLKRLTRALDLAVGDLMDAAYRTAVAPIAALHPED